MLSAFFGALNDTDLPVVERDRSGLTLLAADERDGVRLSRRRHVQLAVVRRVSDLDDLPRGAQRLFQEDAHVAELVWGLDLAAEMAGERGKQLVGARSRAHHVHDDGGQRHRQCTVAPSPPTATKPRRA